MCMTGFFAGIAVAIAAIIAVVLGGLVIAAQVNDVMREINRGQDN